MMQLPDEIESVLAGKPKGATASERQQARRTINDLFARIRELEAALRPFAAAADIWDRVTSPGSTIGSISFDEVAPLRLEPYREAQRVLKRPPAD